MAEKQNEQWVEELLNPDTVRTKFVMMGLFMVVHEVLIDSIKSGPLSFFANEWKEDRPASSEEYTTEVLALDPKKKNDALRGSTMAMRILCQVALGDPDEAWALHHVFSRLGHK